MRKHLLLTALLCMFGFNAKAGANIPRQADISVAGIFLSDPDSTLKTIKNPPKPVEIGDDFPVIQICNSKNTETLTLVFHYGDVQNSFNEFRVGQSLKPIAHCLKSSKKIDQFVTGKGVRLGISKEELIKKLGSSYTEEKVGNQLKVLYKIESFDKSPFLKKYNLPVYYGSYHFEENRLIKFEFGFEYP